MAWLKEKDVKYHFARGYADPSEPQFIIKLGQAGLNVTEADNKVLPGINTVYAALQIAGDGKPRLYVKDDCFHTIREFGAYRFKDAKEGTPQQDNPLKVDDHAMDALRYALKSHRFGSSGYAILDDPF